MIFFRGQFHKCDILLRAVSQDIPQTSITKFILKITYLKSHKPISPKYCIYVSVNQVSLGLDNGLLPVRYQAITWTNADLLSIEHLRTKFSENWIETENFSFIKMHLKMPSAKWRPFYPDRDKLKSPVARSVYSLWNCWWMSPNLTNESLSLVQAMAWCFQATSHTWANVDPHYGTIWCH